MSVDPAGSARRQGKLTLHGQTREIGGTAAVRQSKHGLQVKASFPVTVSSFDIPSPTYLGVGVRDEVMVTVNFTLRPKARI